MPTAAPITFISSSILDTGVRSTPTRRWLLPAERTGTLSHSKGRKVERSKGRTLNKHRRRIDQVLDPEYIAELEDIALDDLRARRGTCDDLDSELSYYRRLLHARMDLLAFELRRRRGEETRSLIEALPDILADGEGTSSHYTMPKTLPVDPPDIPMEGRRSIDKVLADDFLTHLPEISDDELEAIQLMLTIAESGVSEQRRAVYEVLETLNREIARRYSEGIVSVADLLDQ